MAGHIIEKNGKLYRPSQNCGTIYGHAVMFNEIVTLTEAECEEVTVTEIYPCWAPRHLGVYTFNWHGELTVIDAYKDVYTNPLLVKLANVRIVLTGFQKTQ